MESIYTRPYQAETDYNQMRRLLSESYLLAGPPVYCTVGDLDWWRCLEDDPQAVQRARLWFTKDERLVAFAWPADDQVDLIVHPHYRHLDEAMLAWAEREHWRLGEVAGPLRAWSYSSDSARTAALQHHCYSRTGDHFIHFGYSLDRPLPEPCLPAGYHLRPVAGESELSARVAVHRAAFAPSRMTEAKHQTVMNSPTYRPDLDLVAVAPEGSLAAFTLVWYDPAARLGLFEPMGCHPDHQRRGLATALLHEGLRRLARLGAQTAYVNAWGEDPAARLYQAAGFTAVDGNYAWEKSAEPLPG